MRVTVNNDEAAAAVPEIAERLARRRRRPSRSSATSTTTGICCSPSIPTCARRLAKYRINPGNVGGKRRDENFRTIVQHRARARQAGAHRRELGLARPGPAHADDGRRTRAAPAPLDARDVYIEAMLESALRSAAARRGDGTRPRPDHPLGEGLRRAGPRRRLSPARRALRLPAAPRPHRGRARHEGDRRQHGRALDPPRRGDRRHDPRLAHAATRTAIAPRRCCVAQQMLQSLGLRSFTPQVTACPGLRTHDVDLLPEDGRGHPDVSARSDARLARPASRRRGDARRGDGLRRERPRRVEARATSASRCPAPPRIRARRSTWTGSCR